LCTLGKTLAGGPARLQTRRRGFLSGKALADATDDAKRPGLQLRSLGGPDRNDVGAS
jgi:hypothetical protein